MHVLQSKLLEGFLYVMAENWKNLKVLTAFFIVFFFFFFFVCVCVCVCVCDLWPRGDGYHQE